MDQRRDAHALTVHRPRRSGKILELVGSDIADLFTGIRARKPALISRERVTVLVGAGVQRNRIDGGATQKQCYSLYRSAVVGETSRIEHRIGVVQTAHGGKSARPVVGDVVGSVTDCSRAIAATAACQNGVLQGDRTRVELVENAATLRLGRVTKNVLLVTVSVPLLKIPPPTPAPKKKAPLRDKVLLVMARVPRLKMPPPIWALLPEKVLLVTISVAGFALKIPPPESKARPRRRHCWSRSMFRR